MYKGNPFLAFFEDRNSTVNTAVSRNIENKDAGKQLKEQKADKRLAKEAAELQAIFRVTSEDLPPVDFPCVKVHNDIVIEEIVCLIFHRIVLIESECDENISNFLNIPEKVNDFLSEKDPLQYLYESYKRCSYPSAVSKESKNYICEVFNVMLMQPDIVCKSDVKASLKKLMVLEPTTSLLYTNLLPDTITFIGEKFPDSEALKIFKEILREVIQFEKNKLTSEFQLRLFDIFDLYAKSTFLAELLFEEPNKGQNGKLYEDTALGCALSASCVTQLSPFATAAGVSQMKQENLNYQNQPLNEIIRVKTDLAYIQKRTFSIFKTIFKHGSIRWKLMSFIENCLEANEGLSSDWNLQSAETFLGQSKYVTAGFIVNLSAVLLQFFDEAFSSSLETQQNSKILKVDPTFCSPQATNKKGKIRGSHNANYSKLTFLIPREETVEEIQLPREYSFITNIFYHTHRALYIATTILQSDLKRFLQIQQMTGEYYIDMRRTLTVVEINIICYSCAFFGDRHIQNVIKLIENTCLYLNQLAANPNKVRDSTEQVPVTDEIILSESKNLLYLNIPEFVIETMINAMKIMARHSIEPVYKEPLPYIKEFYTFIATYMGSENRINNPHLRAEIAQVLGALVTEKRPSVQSFYNNKAIDLHPHGMQCVRALIHVFVSIEMTSGDTAFEEKLNYRRAMYDSTLIMLDFVNCKNEFKNLALESFENIESAQAPLFLKFVNLIINDAIFLLDEGLSTMTQIRQAELEKERGDWKSLTKEQQTEKKRNLYQLYMLARFHNSLGLASLKILDKLSDLIPKLFSHHILVERVALMLNHYMLKLVGDNRKQFKVKDMEKCEFSPIDVVCTISAIYYNLHKENSFVLAVSGDGRSYDASLFQNALSVLNKSCKFSEAVLMDVVAKVMSDGENRVQQNEDLATDAPDEFLDPILAHLMTDPVYLPSSKMIVDRQTIARHLLSDQIDPFNRQPLTMEEVTPCDELRARIEKWINERRK